MWDFVCVCIYIYIFSASNKPESDLLSADDADKVKQFFDKVNGIREILTRDRMKVAFFGRFVGFLIGLKTN